MDTTFFLIFVKKIPRFRGFFLWSFGVLRDISPQFDLTLFWPILTCFDLFRRADLTYFHLFRPIRRADLTYFHLFRPILFHNKAPWTGHLVRDIGSLPSSGVVLPTFLRSGRNEGVDFARGSFRKGVRVPLGFPGGVPVGAWNRHDLANWRSYSWKERFLTPKSQFSAMSHYVSAKSRQMALWPGNRSILAFLAVTWWIALSCPKH